jgi:hypothetical protein
MSAGAEVPAPVAPTDASTPSVPMPVRECMDPVPPSIPGVCTGSKGKDPSLMSQTQHDDDMCKSSAATLFFKGAHNNLVYWRVCDANGPEIAQCMCSGHYSAPAP